MSPILWTATGVLQDTDLQQCISCCLPLIAKAWEQLKLDDASYTVLAPAHHGSIDITLFMRIGDNLCQLSRAQFDNCASHDQVPTGQVCQVVPELCTPTCAVLTHTESEAAPLEL
jgi:hypothetical protein